MAYQKMVREDLIRATDGRTGGSDHSLRNPLAPGDSQHSSSRPSSEADEYPDEAALKASIVRVATPRAMPSRSARVQRLTRRCPAQRQTDVELLLQCRHEEGLLRQAAEQQLHWQANELYKVVEQLQSAESAETAKQAVRGGCMPRRARHVCAAPPL